jgi:hypothetical protein
MKRKGGTIARVTCVGLITAWHLGCSEPNASVSEPPLAAPDAARALCGLLEEPCCMTPSFACAPQLSCDQGTCRASSDAGTPAARPCRSDEDCASEEVCCSANRVGVCVAASSSEACPLPDLALIVRFAPTPVLVKVLADGLNCPQCFSGSGQRQILRLLPAVANVGSGDLAFGDPLSAPNFEYFGCAGQGYVTDFVRYELIDAAGDVVQSMRAPFQCQDDDDRFDCNFQGVPKGALISQEFGVCDGIDITDVPKGQYLLRLRVNPERKWPESSYDNNTLETSIVVPDFDPLASCPATPNPLLLTEGNRECDWSVDAAHVGVPCDPLATLRYDCANCSTEGNVAIRVCGGDGPCPRDDYQDQKTASRIDSPESPVCVREYFSCPLTRRFTIMRQGADPSFTCEGSVHVETGP